MELSIKIVRDSRENIGAPAKTDFTKIYICDDVNNREYGVLLKHEQSHIWLEHNKRFTKEMDRQIWSIATEMEIARNIYDEEDLAIMTAPLSRIAGAYLPDSIPDLPPDLLLAEEIHDWLVKKREEDYGAMAEWIRENADKLDQCCTHDDHDHGEDGDSEGQAIDVRMLPEDVQELISSALEKIEGAQKSAVAEKSVLDNLAEIKNRTPTLVYEMDALLRKRSERENSYRRPSRRMNADIIHRGKITVPRPPLVEIFVDRSGSFTPEKTERAENAVKEIVKKYHSSIRHDLWFFGSGKISSHDFQGGDTPYHLIHEHLQSSRPKIAVVITDDDGCCDFSTPITGTKILVIPIGCTSTDFSKKIGGIEVVA